MKMTALTDKTLRRFETENVTDCYTAAETKLIECAAYVANMNECAHPEWTEADIYNDFLRVLEWHEIPVYSVEHNESPVELLERTETDIRGWTPRSAWEKGVRIYALELMQIVLEGAYAGYIKPVDLANRKAVKNTLLNGASDWKQYSYGGSSLICDCDIAERVCTPSELRKTHYGEKDPNGSETWLDTQARALWQAANHIAISVSKIKRFDENGEPLPRF